MESIEQLKSSLISIGTELFRFQGVWGHVIQKIDADKRTKYESQFAWFTKRVNKALDQSGIRLVSIEGQLYDPGMAVIPLNIDEFSPDDVLRVDQMLEPIVMEKDTVIKQGTVILGRQV